MIPPVSAEVMTPADFRRLMTLELELFEESFRSKPSVMRKASDEWLKEFILWRRFR